MSRPRFTNKPVARTITFEYDFDNLLDNLKKCGIRPADITMIGVSTLLKGDCALPLSGYRSLRKYCTDQISMYSELAENLKNIIEKLESETVLSPENVPRKIEEQSRSWVDDFHAVRMVGSEKIFLLASCEYEKQPTLFEILDNDDSLSWKNLERYHSLEAVLKIHSQEKEVAIT